MGIWQDIQQGKKPFRPKLGWWSVGKRLLFSLPFLAFGGYLVYRTADCHARLERQADGRVQATVYRTYLGIPLCWQRLADVTAAAYESEMRQVEKRGFMGSSTSKLSLDQKSVSHVVLRGGANGTGQLPVSEMRFDSDSLNHEVAQELTNFLQQPQAGEIERSIPYESESAWAFLAVLFLLGLGGFVFISIPTDVAVWWIQRRYRLQQQRG